MLNNNEIMILIFLGGIYFISQFIRLFFKARKIEYEFTAIVNHTFRTPLTRIGWISKELESDLPINERLLQLQNLNNATNKLLEIVDLIAGIKDIKNTNGYFFEAISLRDVVEKSIAKYREEINKKNITFHVSAFKDAPLMTLDIKKISFAIDTIIENAIFYTPKDGKVLIDYVFGKKHLTIYVADSGIGLSFMDKMRIFSRFYRNKRAILAYPDGMGLKLYLSKQIVNRHHGEIYVKSEGINKGTTVVLKLPFKK